MKKITINSPPGFVIDDNTATCTIGAPSGDSTQVTCLKQGTPVDIMSASFDAYTPLCGQFPWNITAYTGNNGNTVVQIFSTLNVCNTTTPLNITLTSPTNGSAINTSTPTFNWTTNYANATCNLTVDNTQYTGIEGTLGNYNYTATVSGSNPHDWTVSCASGSVSNSTSGVFSVNLPNATLTVIKNFTNDNGGTATTTNLYVNGMLVQNGNAVNNYTAGTYQVSEDTIPDYAATFSGDCDASGAITMASGQSYTCTITNDDIPATLTVVKTFVNDNGGTANTVTLYVNGTSLNTSIANDTPTQFSAGTYRITESPLAGYAATYGGACDASGFVTLSINESKTCTIENDDITPRLTVIKHVIGGGKTAGDFTMAVTGTNVLPSSSFAGAESPGTTVTLNAGSFSVSESGNGGYTQSLSAGCSGTIALGENKTCTINNTDINDAPVITTTAPTTATEDTLYTYDADATDSDGPSMTWSKTGSDTCGGTIDSSGVYTFTPAGPTPPATCVVGIQVSDGSLTDTEAATVTITAVNDAPVAVDDAYATDEDATLNVAAPGVLANDTDTENDTLSAVLVTNVAHGTLELGADGSFNYTPFANYNGADSFTYKANDGGIESNIATVSINVNSVIDMASITLTKAVNNYNGGDAAPDDFGIAIDNTTVLSGSTTSVMPGIAHVLSETGLAGYHFVSMTGDEACPEALGGSVTLGEGESISCTITNQDEMATLTVYKIVDNSNGGTANSSSFNITVEDGIEYSNTFTGEETGTELTLDAGTYEVSETQLDGYSASYSGDCADMDGSILVTLSPGSNLTCTITNSDDVQPTLTLYKIVDNGEQQEGYTANDFTPTVNGTNYTWEEQITLAAGTYQIGESGPEGYSASYSEECENGVVSLTPGQNKECTMTNTFMPNSAPAINELSLSQSGSSMSCSIRPTDAESGTLLVTYALSKNGVGQLNGTANVTNNTLVTLATASGVGYNENWMCEVSVSDMEDTTDGSVSIATSSPPPGPGPGPSSGGGPCISCGGPTSGGGNTTEEEPAPEVNETTEPQLAPPKEPIYLFTDFSMPASVGTGLLTTSQIGEQGPEPLTSAALFGLNLPFDPLLCGVPLALIAIVALWYLMSKAKKKPAAPAKK